MPIVGNTPVSEVVGRGYIKNPITTYAKSFNELHENILNESGFDLYEEAGKTLRHKGANKTLKNFFVENSCDRAGMTPEEYDDHILMMEALYENDRKGVLEYSAMASYNPVIGMTFPIHKNILMNNIYDKGAIQKMVATSPKFTLSMETRYLVAPDGTEIDMFKNQMAMTKAMISSLPYTDVVLTLPEIGTTDILGAIGATSLDNLSLETQITAVQIAYTFAIGELLPTGVAATVAVTQNIWVPTNHLKFAPAYGDYDRSFLNTVEFATSATTTAEDVLSGSMHKNKFNIMAAKGLVKAVKLTARKDASNAMLQTCSVKWGVKTDIVEIPSAIPLNVPISPEEVKDIGALYQTDQLSKIMGLLKIALDNYKDDMIRTDLTESFKNLDPSQRISESFDFAPRDGYALDHVEYRHKTFFDYLDTQVTLMLQQLNDPNMSVTIFGRPDLIRKITPTEYTYQSPSSIGPVALDFTKTVTTSDDRVYNFISSLKLNFSEDISGIDPNQLMIILSPRNSDRIIYRIYDYQMYVSNEIRNAQNYALPAIHAFERWKFVEYQPVQGRLTILNPTGLKS